MSTEKYLDFTKSHIKLPDINKIDVLFGDLDEKSIAFLKDNNCQTVGDVWQLARNKAAIPDDPDQIINAFMKRFKEQWYLWEAIKDLYKCLNDLNKYEIYISLVEDYLNLQLPNKPFWWEIPDRPNWIRNTGYMTVGELWADLGLLDSDEEVRTDKSALALSHFLKKHSNKYKKLDELLDNWNALLEHWFNEFLGRAK